MTMDRYDPLQAPDPTRWLALDEQERIALVEDYHRRARIRLPNLKAHAVAHAIVENQIALGDETPVRRTLLRLMGEGLDRHDAVHAIGFVVVGNLHDVIHSAPSDAEPEPGISPKERYYAELAQLTAKSWREQG
jgi:hypothetical protein